MPHRFLHRHVDAFIEILIAEVVAFSGLSPG